MERIVALIEWLENVSQQIADGSPQWIAAALALNIFGGLLVLSFTNAAFKRGHEHLVRLAGTRIRAISYRDQELFSAEEVTVIVLGLLRLVRFGVYGVLGYLFMMFSFGLFPATQGLAGQLLGYVIGSAKDLAVGTVEYIPNMIFLLVLLFVTRGVIKLLRLAFMRVWLGRAQISNFPSEFAQPTFRIVRFFIIVFALMVAYPYMPGARSPAFQAISLFLGFLVSMGSSGAISNIIAGIALTYMRAFNIGDRVRIADAMGDVIEKTTFVTRVRTPKNVDITIPNSMVLNNHIINYTTNATGTGTGVAMHTTVTIGYDVDWRKVHELMIAAALETEFIMPEPAPFVLQTALGDFYVHYELNAYTKQPGKMPTILSELHQHIQDQFHSAGVEIASPHLAQHRDGNVPVIPDPYLPQNFEPGGFRFLGLPGSGPRSKS